MIGGVVTLGLGLALAGAADAPAERAPRLGVVALNDDPTLDEALRKAAARHGGYVIEDAAVMADAVAGITRVGGLCEITDGACWAKLAIAADVDALLVGRADRRSVQVTFVDTMTQTSSSADGAPGEEERVALMLLGIEEPRDATSPTQPPVVAAAPAPSASAGAAEDSGPGIAPWLVAGGGGAVALAAGVTAIVLDVSLARTLLEVDRAGGAIGEDYYQREIAFNVALGAVAAGAAVLVAGLVWGVVASGDAP